MSADRRSYQRYVLWFPVTLVTSAGRIGTICRDVSSGGMLVSAPCDVPIDSRITCRFRLSLDDADELVTSGRIVRADRNADDLELVFPHRVAIEFDHPTPDIEELLKHAQERLREAR